MAALLQDGAQIGVQGGVARLQAQRLLQQALRSGEVALLGAQRTQHAQAVDMACLAAQRLLVAAAGGGELVALVQLQALGKQVLRFARGGAGGA